jgi:hypothetical protein
MQTELDAMKAENERLRVALRFYANREHYNLDDDEDFGTVSGEPDNWLYSGHNDSTTMVEDGTVARRTLLGEAIVWDIDGEDYTPQPIEGERPNVKVSGEASVPPQG